MPKSVTLSNVSWIVCCLSPQLSQWRSFPNSAPLASVYAKFFGQEIAFANIDKNLVDQVIAVFLKFQVQPQQVFCSLLLYKTTCNDNFCPTACCYSQASDCW